METDQLFNNHILQTYKRSAIEFISGKSATLTGKNRRKYIDFLSGIGVNNLGYAHPAVIGAAKKALLKPIHISNLFYIESQAQLAKLIQKASFPGKSFFCNSGAEANEAAYKFCVKYGKSIAPNKVEIVSAWNSFHGRTMGALSLTGQAKYQNHFKPFAGNVKHLHFNETKPLHVFTPNTAAVFIETIQGEGGVNIITKEFLKHLRHYCDKTRALLIVDDVQAGCGRTGKPFSFQHFDIPIDGFTLAKGLAGGFPIGCFTIRKDLAGIFEPGDHASTFGGNPFVTQVALEVFKIIASPAFQKKTVETAELFRTQLNLLKTKYPFVKEFRQCGLMIAIEMADSSISTAEIAKKSLIKGLIINSIHNQIIRMLPPLVITKDEALKGFSILDSVLKEYL